MSIFKQTFKRDQPVYFPANWETGKTTLQLHQEWSQTFQYAVYSNVLQIAFASMFVCLLAALVSGMVELFRISRLQEGTNEKILHKKYLKMRFLGPLGILAGISLTLLGVLVMEEWTRNALFKGLCFCTFAYLSSKSYKKIKTMAKRGRLQIKRYLEKRKETASHLN